MKASLLVMLLSALLVTSSRAQEISFPDRMGCQYCQPRTPIVGPVRTVLASERRGERSFGISVETYDTKGRKVESIYHDASTTPEAPPDKLIRLDEKTIYRYDDKGKLIEADHYSINGTQGSKSVFTYDEKGRLAEDLYSNIDGTPFAKYVFTYQSEKHTVTILTTSYIEGRVIPPFKATLTYNNQGQWIRKEMYTSDGSPDGVAEFTYDEKGNVAKEDRGDYAHVFTYQYDLYGNWVERQDTETYLKSGKTVQEPHMTTFRVITYYGEQKPKN